MSSQLSTSGAAAFASTISDAQKFINKFNEEYEAKHYKFEEQFWGTKMALKSTDDNPYSSELLSKTKKEMENLLSNPATLKEARDFKSALLENDNDGEKKDLETVKKTLDIIIKTCQCYDMSDSPEAKSIREETTTIESKLEKLRNEMKLGYYEKVTEGDSNKKKFIEASSVALRNLMRTSDNEDIRKAAYDGLLSIGPFICENGFVDIVKKRNAMAKKLGYVDYYDYKVSNAEGFNKEKLFEILDTLEVSTRSLNDDGRKELCNRFGNNALEPWNIGYKMSGSIIQKMDPYFPFSKAVERYVKSYHKLGIKYQGATMNLDLLDRPKKYSNGFCHWPKCSWIKGHGKWSPSVANFTSLANPKAVGSGYTALNTLMHEAGHAAHFANIKQPSPLFSQERAPTSVAYAENQSMFLDSLVGDAAWRAKYATSPADNKPIPFDIIEEEIKSTHPFAVFQLRAMLVVSYFEKALYELPEDEVTPEKIQTLAEEIENKIQGGPSPRPLLSVPHIVSDEASCYYQGYTLAEMSVHQTREYFLDKYGYIVDNANVGPELTKAYWECGNSLSFLDIVKELTGKDLSGNAWTNVLKEGVGDKINREKKEYDNMLEKIAGENDADNDDTIDLDMVVRFVDGDRLISDSSTAEGGLLGACKEFEKFVASRVADEHEKK